jgi:hypothetical protein
MANATFALVRRGEGEEWLMAKVQCFASDEVLQAVSNATRNQLVSGSKLPVDNGSKKFHGLE